MTSERQLRNDGIVVVCCCDDLTGPCLPCRCPCRASGIANTETRDLKVIYFRDFCPPSQDGDTGRMRNTDLERDEEKKREKRRSL